MKKLFFVVVILLSCCTFLSAAKKTVIKVPEDLKKEFNSNGEWCFFYAPKSARNRLKYFTKNYYKIFHEGDLLEKVLYKNKYYARDLSKNIYKPHWEMKKDFSPHFIPAKQYIDSLNGKIKLLEKAIQESKQKLSNAQATLKADQKRYNHYLCYKKYKTGRGKFSSVIKSKLRYYKKLVKNEENDIKTFARNLKNSENRLRDTKKFKVKTEALYKQYVIAKK
jgi:hypothetical protein